MRAYIPSDDCCVARVPPDRNKECAKVFDTNTDVAYVDAEAYRGEGEAGEDERRTHLNMVGPYSPYHDHNHCGSSTDVSSHESAHDHDYIPAATYTGTVKSCDMVVLNPKLSAIHGLASLAPGSRSSSYIPIDDGSD